MPTSHFYQLDTIVGLIAETRPKSLLDIGVGFGKYGVLAREYLEFWQGDDHYGQWDIRVDGVEIHASYLTDLHRYIYDNTYVGDALTVLPTLELRYDLILLIDVLEHFNAEGGKKMLELCLAHGRNVIVSTPADDTKQTARFENPYEEHKSHWSRNDLKRLLDNSFFIPNRSSQICYAGEQAGEVRRRFRRHASTTAFRENMPTLTALLRSLKQARRSLGRRDTTS